MSAPLDELYFRWLYGLVSSVKQKSSARTYWSLLRLLFRKEFVWFVPNDDNRVEDGKELRYEFLDAEEIETVDPEWIDMGCSMLEMLIGLSRRLSFEAEGEPREWFWRLLENVGLASYNDRDGVPAELVDEILERIIWRTYSAQGDGGLFPLRSPSRDQRKVEIWYQLNTYLSELA